MLLIRHGHVKPIAGKDFIGDVLVNEGKIIALGEHIEAGDAEVLDADGLLVTPGFVDAHTHIGVDEEAMRWEGADYNEMSDPVTPDMRGLDGINPMDEAFASAVGAGVTAAMTGPGSANVIGGTFVAIKLRGTDVSDMILKDPAAMKAAFGENPKGCYGQQGNKKPVTRMGVAALLRENLWKAQRYAEEIAEAEKDDSKKRPFDPALEALLPVIRREIPLKCHAHRADDILTAIRIAKELNISITLDHCTEGHLIIPQLLKAGFPVLVGPSLGHKSKIELKHKSFKTPGLLNAAGLKVCLITDAPVIPLQYLPLCAGLAVKDGLPEDAAWQAITLNPAQVIGVANRIGSLEPGKDADIAVFEGNPLRDIQARTRQVFIDGIPQLRE